MSYKSPTPEQLLARDRFRAEMWKHIDECLKKHGTCSIGVVFSKADRSHIMIGIRPIDDKIKEEINKNLLGRPKPGKHTFTYWLHVKAKPPVGKWGDM